MDNHFDILIIGAGMAGASLGARLASSGRVAVFDMEDQAGYHSTGRSAASWIENYGNDTIVKLNRASFEFLNSPPEDFPCGCVLRKRGVLWVARPGSESNLGAMFNDDVVEIDASRALELVPALKVSGLRRFGYEAEAYDIDVATLHQSHLKVLKANGGQLLCNAQIVAIERAGDVWQVTTKDDAKYSADIIVNAAGAWGDEIARIAGVNPVGLEPRRRSAAMIPVPDEYAIENWPFVVEVEEAFYFRPDGGKLMLSPADAAPVEPHDAWADDMEVARAAAVFDEVMQFGVTRVTHSWGGLRTFVSDGSPVVGMDDTGGFFWFAGQGGYGIQTSPAMASLGASLLLNQPLEAALLDQQFDVDSVSPRRFSR